MPSKELLKRILTESLGVINFSIFRHEKDIEAIYIRLREGKVSFRIPDHKPAHKSVF
jgi:hypothetical protein